MNEPKAVLVVDRSKQVRDHLLELLTRYGYKVLETGSSSDALDILNVGDVDLLIVEVGTPGRVEETMIKELRSTPSLKDIPVIVLAEGTTGSEHVTGELKEVGEGGASLILDRDRKSVV